MSRSFLIVCVCVVIAGMAAVATVVLVRGESSVSPEMSEEQRATREKFFGTGKELPPIEKGQEMRPRW
ncbi:entry exclusion protein TrbK [Sinorhizobium meliloti]|uniref:Probable conjugal transfer protein TrbK n=2 Tax=Rhizobium meliloti TaxID=382 RepID=A4KVR5_SINMM|nr:probable conjugal transfer protein TrbK [Sinorhizobium meliloti SM11]ARS66158.1 entry exclusion protein TrbK [Sinorhizobium meliloti RU11/001]MDE3765524.1 entry exclusion protein TrbK [Sinorhizobium meliloti]MDE3779302.1 entry exclusion protein TrbK [Sinorhizobium meliloti]MDE3804857.1 entry exclusion protein TrbK [Sinorhizobium meliloti]